MDTGAFVIQFFCFQYKAFFKKGKKHPTMCTLQMPLYAIYINGPNDGAFHFNIFRLFKGANRSETFSRLNACYRTSLPVVVTVRNSPIGVSSVSQNYLYRQFAHDYLQYKLWKDREREKVRKCTRVFSKKFTAHDVIFRRLHHILHVVKQRGGFNAGTVFTWHFLGAKWRPIQ